MKKMKKSIYLLLLPFLAVLQAGPAMGQNPDGTVVEARLSVSVLVMDEEGRPVEGAVVTSGEAYPTGYSDRLGRVHFLTGSRSVVTVESRGYVPVKINLSVMSLPSVVVLEKERLNESLNERVNRADGGTTLRRDLTGVSDRISGDRLSRYPDIVLGNSLQGLAAGLVIRPTAGGLTNNTPNIYLRGLHSRTDNQALVMVDGIERPFDELIAEEIESVELLKDPTTKILYGPRAANGILWVTTKRGEYNRQRISVTAEAGVSQLTRRAEYLNSYDYALLYNEARANDGLLAFYSDRQLQGYRNSTGAHDMLYPDVDYNKEFIHDNALYRKVALQVDGGGNNVKYAVVVGYAGTGGYEKVGKTSVVDRLNFRGSIDVKMNDILSVNAAVSARLDMKNFGSKAPLDIYSAINSHRPNEYPLTFDPTLAGLPADSTGMPTFGASLAYADNFYADMKYGGTTTERDLNSQAALGLDISLDKFIGGLKARVGVSFDNYNYFQNTTKDVYMTYAINPYTDLYGDEQLQVTLMRDRVPNDTYQTRSGERTLRTSTWNMGIDYDRTFGLHDLGAVLFYNFMKSEVKGASQDLINSNHSMRLNYGFDKRLVAEVDMALMGSNRFAGSNKFFFSYAVGSGWIISNEDFIGPSSAVSYLKLKASYGMLGYDASTPYLTYRTGWKNGGTPQFGERNNTSNVYRTEIIRLASPGLKWERSTEYNVGVEASFLRERLYTELNWFGEKRTDIIGINRSEYGDFLGDFRTYSNIGEVRNKGFEFTVNWRDRSGDFTYSLGLNGIWSKNELVAWNQVEYPEEYRWETGRPTDALYGYRAIGLFGRDVALAGHYPQHIGTYREGDIAYRDLNDDGQVDQRDQEMIGNTFPRLTTGINIELGYKNWGLYILGVAETGMDVETTNNYYWNRAQGKYSVLASQRYHPTANPGGKYPALTSLQGQNNYQTSTFWLEKADFFRLKNVELSYTFQPGNKRFPNMRFHVRATNLFVISKIKDLDPELINAGVNNYPVIRTITGGVTVKF